MRRFVDIRKNFIENESGSIVVETTISLSVFLFVIVTFYSMINVCLAQAKIQSTACYVAEDISKLCYLYQEFELTGESDMSSQEAVNELQQAMATMAIPGATSYTTKAVAEDDERVLEQFMAAASSGESGLNANLSQMCNSLAINYLTGDEQEGAAYLKHLGVVGASETVSGLDFSESRINGDEIKIVVKYRVRLADYLGLDMKFDMKQFAYTKAWNAG